MTLKKQRGFSLLEMLAVVAIGFTLAGITFIAMLPMMSKSHLSLRLFHDARGFAKH